MRNAAAVLVALVFSAASTLALATNGYFTHGVGAESKGMAGTGIGSNSNMGAIMTASNPALGVFAGDSWEARPVVLQSPAQLRGVRTVIKRCTYRCRWWRVSSYALHRTRQNRQQ